MDVRGLNSTQKFLDPLDSSSSKLNFPSPAVQAQSEAVTDHAGPAFEMEIHFEGISEEAVEAYFASKEGSNSSVRDRLDRLRSELLSQEDFDRELLARLFQMKDSDREMELRKMLQEIEQAQDLEKIIFGEKQSKIEQFELDFQFEVRYEASQSAPTAESEGLMYDMRNFVASGPPPRESDPLILDLSGDGIDTTGIENGITFDIDGDGTLDQTSFVSGDDYALALDKNGNGRIDSGRELFGDADGSRDGIEALRKYDSNDDGLIDAHDEIFDELKLVNSNRSAKTLAQAGVESISLQRQQISGYTNQGDRIQDGVSFSLSNGAKRQALDVYFQNRNRGR